MTTLALTLNFYHFSTATPTLSYPGCQGHDMSTFSQCHTQSPQASWSAGGRQGRLWSNGKTDLIFLLNVFFLFTVTNQKP